MSITLKDLPDVSFAEKDINKILTDMVSEYEKSFYQSTGEHKKLYPGDPIRVFLYTQALRELQMRVLIDDAAKQNLLKYARKENLVHLGALSRTELLQAKPATVTEKFVLSQARPVDEIISSGTRVSPGSEIYFEVKEDVTVTAGTQEIVIDVICTEPGLIGNNFTPGQINILVDPIPWIDRVENTETSRGGADEEDTESYRERIHIAPEGFSVAGPEGAYEYFARQFSSSISDIRVNSPKDGVVDIRVLLQNGSIPETPFINKLNDYLSAKNRRPLTDKVQVNSPVTVNYDIKLTYFISKKSAGQEESIKEKVEKAISEYATWQRSSIGRDVNPDELIYRIRQAGARDKLCYKRYQA